MAKTNVGNSYQGFSYDMPLDMMAALVCVYQGRPLASTLFTTKMFVENCTSRETCVDCIYSGTDFKVNAYYNSGKLFLMAGDRGYNAVFIVF